MPNYCCTICGIVTNSAQPPDTCPDCDNTNTMRDLNALVPVPSHVSRNKFDTDTTFAWSDVAQRAIPSIYYIINLNMDQRMDFSEREALVPVYAQHPAAVNLMRALGQGQVTLNIPANSEVMYVITTDYQIILATRDQHEHHLPHPTLIGGDSPQVLSAGIVEFFQGRISRVCVNYSGHFKPNSPSSIEVSLGMFSQLPSSVYHANFQGFYIFGQALPILLNNATGNGASPFNITAAPMNRVPRENTQAMDVSSGQVSLRAITDSQSSNLTLVRRQGHAAQRIKHHLAHNLPPPFPYCLLFDRRARFLYGEVARAASRAGATPTNPQWHTVTSHAHTQAIIDVVNEGLRRLWR